MNDKNLSKATFAGGCFWCMVKPFETQPGIYQVLSGYTGGHTENPTYEEVCSGTTGHAEAVEILFDPDIFPYEKLVDIYFRQTDPTDSFGQFADRGTPYRPAIFYHNDKQRQIAEKAKIDLASSGRFNQPIVTEIVPAQTFYKAESYHQNFHHKNETRYRLYRSASGRDAFIYDKWKD